MSEPVREARVANAGQRGGRPAGILQDGIVAGMIGAAIVALWFFVLDIARGKPFFTPSLLGNALLLGKSVEQTQEVNAIMVFAYTGVHGILFLIAGVAVSWMFHQIERNPQLGLVLLLIFLLFESILFGFEVTLVPHLVGALGAFTVGFANLLSAGGMFWFLIRRHPEALARLRAAWHD
ncbi:MAG TPA: hypothetical protein DEP35_10840 [Deltaproteobacteria bacterium]|nr:hypothetical protein [Deltaproteobacteria bacterium]